MYDTIPILFSNFLAKIIIKYKKKRTQKNHSPKPGFNIVAIINSNRVESKRSFKITLPINFIKYIINPQERKGIISVVNLFLIVIV